MKSYFAKRNIFTRNSSVKFLFHPRVETRISHTAKNMNCAVSLVRKQYSTNTINLQLNVVARS